MPFQSEVLFIKFEKKIENGFTRPLVVAAELLLCTKISVATHVYQSPCWILSNLIYHRIALRRTLRNFLWVSDANVKGFHRVRRDIYRAAREIGGLGY